jgi:hypothetical protein
MDLLTTYTHNSELQAITAPPLISTIHKTPQHPAEPFSRLLFTNRCLATNYNSGDFSASCAQVLSFQPSVNNSIELIAPTVLVVTSLQ